ncbi:MAG: lipoprotein N-acyltransferase Lnb domain-containing protein [Bdellovibrio sp.]
MKMAYLILLALFFSSVQSFAESNSFDIAAESYRKQFASTLGKMLKEIAPLPSVESRRNQLQTFFKKINDENHFELYSNLERKTLMKCQIAWQVYGNDPICRKAMSYKKTFSDHEDFLGIASWRQKQKQDLKQTSIPALPEVFFIDQAAQFFLDEEYSCSEPALSDFFSRRFGVTPTSKCNSKVEIPNPYSFEENNKSESPLVKLDQIDPSRIYQIHYFLADSGDEIDSAFGHAMFRLIICSPKRHEIGPDCLKDTSYHMVVGYRAIIDGDVEVVRAIKTGYPSKLFAEPLWKTLENYSMNEQRNLKSFALNLSKSEINRFIRLLPKSIFNSQSLYLFLTNNCATQARDLLRSALSRPLSPLHFESADIITPKGLVGILTRSGLTKSWTASNEKQKFVLFFPALTNSYNNAKQIYNDRVPDLVETFESDVLTDENSVKAIFPTLCSDNVQIHTEEQKVIARHLCTNFLMVQKQKYKIQIQRDVESRLVVKIQKQPDSEKIDKTKSNWQNEMQNKIDKLSKEVYAEIKSSDLFHKLEQIDKNLKTLDPLPIF